jgi:hypothetical protein|tara:strand:- start:585 stop:797 length:213 start_codon:yes stop_codon:yes gene_type:complete
VYTDSIIKKEKIIMTKKSYIKIADIFKHHFKVLPSDDTARVLCCKIATVLQEDNPRFDMKKFINHTLDEK